jgi:hypothetical protein
VEGQLQLQKGGQLDEELGALEKPDQREELEGGELRVGEQGAEPYEQDVAGAKHVDAELDCELEREAAQLERNGQQRVAKPLMGVTRGQMSQDAGQLCSGGGARGGTQLGEELGKKSVKRTASGDLGEESVSCLENRRLVRRVLSLEC